MKRNTLIGAMILLFFISTTVSAAPTDYNDIMFPSLGGNTAISWTVVECPDVPVAWGWTGEGAWLATPGSAMTFSITSIHEVDIEGILQIGNFTITANDTDVARELVLGVWGFTPFFPGLVVPVGQTNMEDLNSTAYASAMRVQGNYLNGSMLSVYETVTIGTISYECIVFNYEQDSSGFGEPQRTSLAYDTTTGILVKGNTSYFFGAPFAPYSLVIELDSVIQFGPIFLTMMGSGIILILGVVVVLMKRR